jgi:hypothetical protein
VWSAWRPRSRRARSASARTCKQDTRGAGPEQRCWLRRMAFVRYGPTGELAWPARDALVSLAARLRRVWSSLGSRVGSSWVCTGRGVSGAAENRDWSIRCRTRCRTIFLSPRWRWPWR